MILDVLADAARGRVFEAKKHAPLAALRDWALSLPSSDFRFERALDGAGLSLICEIKRASPSKGVISEAFPYLDIAQAYEDGKAAAVSCLTEPTRFLGSDAVFREIRASIRLPMLRKDFTVDEYQLFEAKTMGADAVLLICALLDTKTLARYLDICDTLGLSALTEAHDEKEVDSAVSAGARIIGVNNRNLKDFSVDFSNAARLRDRIPPSALFVAESGVRTADDVSALKELGADAALIGEALMRAPDIKARLAAFRSAAR